MTAIDSRERRLRRVYNITSKEYDTILEHQGGVCAVCLRPPIRNRLSIDHDHKTGLVRGLLHFGCNVMLARAYDNAEFLRRAADYLDSPPAIEALGAERFGLKGPVVRKRRRRRRR
jgi:hypothetical protein